MYKYSSFNTISCRFGVMKPTEVHEFPLRKEFDESLADPTFFMPTSEAVRSIASSNSSIASGYYDFPDGKDDGRAIPITRKKGYDIAELSQSVQSATDEMKKEIETAIEVQKENLEIQKRVQARVKENQAIKSDG